MSQPLATVKVKQTKNGSSVIRHNVTPAEVMILAADFKSQSGGDPILILAEIDPKREEKQILPLQTKLDGLQAQYEANESTQDITEEVRDARFRSLSARIVRVQKNIQEWQNINAIRGLDAEQEKARLMMRYQHKLVEHIFPGQLPKLPETFDEALRGGLKSKAMTGERMVFEGGIR